MKKFKNYSIVLGLALLLFQIQNTNAQCYLDAANTSQVVATGITGPIATGCDMLQLDPGLIIAVYVWSGPNDQSTIAWQLNGGTIRDTVLQDADGRTPDVAIAHYGSYIYAVVAYKSSKESGEAQWESYKWNGTDFGQYTSINTSGDEVATAIHVDGDAAGHVTIVYDDVNSENINITGADIKQSSPYSLTFDNTADNLGSIPISGSTNSYPDVAITTIDGDSSIVCVSWQESGGGIDYVEAAGFFQTDIYNNSSHSNIHCNLTFGPDKERFFEYVSGNSGNNTIGKTSISLTERHAYSYKVQPFLAWEEDSSNLWTYVFGSAQYWDTYFFPSVYTIDNLTDQFGPIYQDKHLEPQVINAYHGDYMITGWNYSETSFNCITNNIEPLAVPMSYSGVYTPSTSTSSYYYLGIGRPGQHGGSAYPLHKLYALSLAGKQSDDILYFYCDSDTAKLYSRTENPSASQLRLPQATISNNDRSKLIVSPNPINEKLILILPEADKEYNLSLYDINGRVMISAKGTSEDLQQHLRLISPHLNPGLYLLKIDDATIRMTQLLSKF